MTASKLADFVRIMSILGFSLSLHTERQTSFSGHRAAGAMTLGKTQITSGSRLVPAIHLCCK